jgi:hypothetical protein
VNGCEPLNEHISYFANWIEIKNGQSKKNRITQCMLKKRKQKEGTFVGFLKQVTSLVLCLAKHCLLWFDSPQWA